MWRWRRSANAAGCVGLLLTRSPNSPKSIGCSTSCGLPGGAGMSRERPRNIAVSVADRLLQRARQTGGRRAVGSISSIQMMDLQTTAHPGFPRLRSFSFRLMPSRHQNPQGSCHAWSFSDGLFLSTLWNWPHCFALEFDGFCRFSYACVRRGRSVSAKCRRFRQAWPRSPLAPGPRTSSARETWWRRRRGWH